ncbi:hypothetical protein G4V62_00650 [Bacillaceae bacterium SIJ1]|uniref:hypothetical protein n=1 Tax=Litoribacterium kuwaitense TaxID=1398745 RepID=UPI0013ED41A8|nr:hypothetical protein [Litoribacterium kuwaitense]NGP43545.1 hypothetical protein [Litoribacterium kuwaitense]
MKQFIILVLSFAIIYAIVYDIRSGTIPTVPAVSGDVAQQNSQYSKFVTDTQTVPAGVQPTFTVIEVAPGDTVLGIIEQLHENHLPVPIEQITEDFLSLNELEASEIRAGQAYRFPLYHDS